MKYLKAEAEIIEFDNSDVVTESNVEIPGDGGSLCNYRSWTITPCDDQISFICPGDFMDIMDY